MGAAVMGAKGVKKALWVEVLKCNGAPITLIHTFYNYILLYTETSHLINNFLFNMFYLVTLLKL